MITAHSLGVRSGLPSLLLNSNFRPWPPTLSWKFIWTGHTDFYPSLFLTPKALPNICLFVFQDFGVGTPSFCSPPNLSSSYVISTPIWATHLIASSPLFETNVRDPTSPHLIHIPNIALGLVTPGNCVILPSFTSSSHPPFHLTLCLFFNFSEKNEESGID